MEIDPFAPARRFVESLRRVERLSAADLARYQAPLLERLCRHAALQAPFQAGRLKPLFAGGDAAEGAFRLDAWAEIEPFNRADAQAAGADLHAHATPEAVGPATRMFTSGSTGRPLEFRRSAMADIAGLAQQERLYETHGVDRSGVLGWIRHVDAKEGFTERRRKGWNLADPQAEVCEISKALSTAELAAWLRRERPSALMAAPSVVDGLIGELQPGEVALSHVLVTSEPAREELAEAVAETFGAKLVDSYGTREVGAIATTCPDAGPAKHVEAATILVEILRPDGTPAEPGESGRVVATPLYAYATPFIRYDLGDTAVQGAQVCACGRGLPLIETVLGRSHALFRFADGTTRFPVGLKRVGRFVPLVQMQAVQTHLDRVEVRYVPKASGPTPDFESAAAHLKRVLHPDLRIDFIAVEAIAPGPGGKHEDLISRVT